MRETPLNPMMAGPGAAEPPVKPPAQPLGREPPTGTSTHSERAADDRASGKKDKAGDGGGAVQPGAGREPPTASD